MQEGKKKSLQSRIPVLCILILILYPLRHVNLGIDLWDAGYNGAHFEFAGTGFMDPMWFFATYLSTQAGRLLTYLPWGHTYLGLNVYTGLLVSAIVAGSFLFLIRKIRIPCLIAFAGELMAISLCWAPTAMLYCYLTYGLFLAASALLYCGLTENRPGYLAAAGALLGLNVGVRFPNLTETALILAVWGYGLIRYKGSHGSGCTAPSAAKKVFGQTLLCAAGYSGGLCLFLVWIAFRYGPGNYIEGILRLFQMTEVAKDYRPLSMLQGIYGDYLLPPVTYLLKRMLLLPTAGCVLCLLCPKRFEKTKKCLIALLTLGLFFLLKQSGFYTMDFHSYYSMRYPSIVALLTATLLAFLELFRKEASENDRLFALLVLLSLFITPLGGNNGMYSNFNNLFLAAPFLLWTVFRFCRERRHILFFPIKCLLCLILFCFVFQGICFGSTFVYEEADGGRQLHTEITEIPTLTGMRTNAQKASCLTGLYQYLQKDGLAERSCILFGEIPGVSYCLHLTPAMNTWPDLRSYPYEIMKKDLETIEEQTKEAGRPIIILEARYADYKASGESGGFPAEETAARKFALLMDFMDRCGYRAAYRNEKFAVYK